MSTPKKTKSEEEAVSNFREYLRCKTVHPDPDYEPAIKFLIRQAEEIGLEFKRFDLVERNPIAILTWPGKDPSLPSILLNSHMDVVPVFEEYWTHPPFDAHKTEDGKIYARGSQDMKCVGIQYLEAIRHLKSNGHHCLRTIHMSFTPDEEVGSDKGMLALINSGELKQFNIGFVLDEGLASPTDTFILFNAERAPWRLRVSCKGNTGHGSLLIENTAGEKLSKIMGKAFEFRRAQEEKLKSNPQLHIGEIATVNLTIVEGGVLANVVPAELTAVFDIRVPPTIPQKEFEQTISDWVAAGGEGCSYEFTEKHSDQTITSIDDTSPWWRAFKGACDKAKIHVEPRIFPAGTDSRFLRAAGYQAYGFSPMNNTPILLHEHDEYLSEDVFLRGIDIYSEILPAMANVASH
ncbi:aminoacylase-1-like [Oscarella lobularis]|uniref:aminoacylase-1-like n=1 Tax=Oscarella lobularis TaxID=121494 RepID=UPI00331319C6